MSTRSSGPRGRGAETGRESLGSRTDDPKAAGETFPAWEQIEAGRYMPRRTRGSFPGRELG